MKQELKYKVIKSREQYFAYCALLEELILSNDASRQDEIELLELLIDAWDDAHDPFDNYDPIQLLQALMTENNLKQIELAQEIGIGESYLSEILSYKKGLSKKIIQKLSDAFGIRKEAFAKSYELKRISKINKLANYLLPEREADASAFVFNEPGMTYQKSEASPAKSKRTKKKDQ